MDRQCPECGSNLDDLCPGCHTEPLTDNERKLLHAATDMRDAILAMLAAVDAIAEEEGGFGDATDTVLAAEAMAYKALKKANGNG